MADLESFAPGERIDGFIVGAMLHAGAQGRIYAVCPAEAGTGPAFPAVMKVPRLRSGDAAESLLSYETEAMILPALGGPHVPRFVAAGDITRRPYLVVERIAGESLTARLARTPLADEEVAALGAAIADALQSIHQQDVVHCDLKPDNVMLRPDGRAVLIDFGLSHHAHFPDLLAEEKRFAAGSAPYVSPEQVLGSRSDTRSDLFSLGVVLYELATGELPFGTPATLSGLRDRLWMAPVPPRARRAGLAPWLQEIILRCLETDAAQRYQTAAHLAFDLRRPAQVRLTARASRTSATGMLAQVGRWWGTRSRRWELAPRQARRTEARVVMVAVDTTHPDDARQPEIRRVTGRVLSLSDEFRLVCVSVVRSASIGGSGGGDGEARPQELEHLVRLRHWVEPLRVPPDRLSLHVIEAGDPAGALLDFAHANHVDLIVLGAPGPDQQRMAWWRSVASGVTANARCSVHVVRVPEPGGAQAQ